MYTVSYIMSTSEGMNDLLWFIHAHMHLHIHSKHIYLCIGVGYV